MAFSGSDDDQAIPAETSEFGMKLTGATGAWLGDSPVVCGGFDEETRQYSDQCFKVTIVAILVVVIIVINNYSPYSILTVKCVRQHLGAPASNAQGTQTRHSARPG